MRYGVFALLVACVFGCGGKPVVKIGDVKEDQQHLQGVWKPVEAIADGEKLSDLEKRFADSTVEFSGDLAVFKAEGKVAEINQIKLDASQEPRAIDLTVVDERGTVQKLYDKEDRAYDFVRKGIYVIEGDILKVCTPEGVGEPRPDKFEAPPGTGLTVMIFQKVRK